MDTISVIIPVYNIAEYLDTCVGSLINQTHKELEIILIDDGSTDDSGRICDQWAERDKRVRVIHSENHGVSHARNLGLKAATGDYIGFVDGDDWVDHDMYEIMLHYLKSNRADIHVGGYVTETGTSMIETLQRGKECVFSREEGLRMMMCVPTMTLFGGHLWDKLFTKNVFKNLYLCEDLKLREDTWTVWQAFKRANRISYAPQFSYHYVMRGDSATHIKMKRENGTYLDSMKKIWKDAQKLDTETAHIVDDAYRIEELSVLKEILFSGTHDFNDVFRESQSDIRTHLWQLLKDPLLRNKQKLGFLYFSMPKVLTKSGKAIVRHVVHKKL